jgi:hypothetical protein
MITCLWVRDPHPTARDHEDRSMDSATLLSRTLLSLALLIRCKGLGHRVHRIVARAVRNDLADRSGCCHRDPRE